MFNHIKKLSHKLKNFLTKINKNIQFRIDTTRYFFDKPSFDYQPLPWVGIDNAPIRGESTLARWSAIQPYLKNQKSLKDIGCCVGFFCHKATEIYNINTVGIDSSERFLRIASFTQQYVKNGEKEIFFNMVVDNKNVEILPVTDVTILFSIWHHWVHHYGLDQATKILKVIWSKTNSVLLFESGEEEIKDKFKLPFDKNASDWLLNYLTSNLTGAKIDRVGLFEVGKYKDYELKKHKRTVFAIVKN